MHSVNTYQVKCSFLKLAKSSETRQKFCHIYLLYDNGLEWLRGDLVCPDPTVKG